MFEVAEVGRRLSKAEYSEIVPGLRTELLKLQRELREADFPVLILLNGVDGAGKSETARLLSEWMDARHLRVHAFGPHTEEQKQRPRFWRYWMALPPKGKIGVYMGNWYTRPILDHVEGDLGEDGFSQLLNEAREFEKLLTDDGALIIKLWFHLSKDRQRKRLKKLESNEDTAWRVRDLDWKRFKRYDEFRSVSERALRDTSTGDCPWTVIEGTSSRYRDVKVARELIQRITEHKARREGYSEPKVPEPAIDDPLTVLDRLDLSQTVERDYYHERLEKLQGRLFRLSRKLAKKEKGCIIVFEGWDAGGKGGAIRRLIHALDPRQYHVIPVAAPTDEESAQHYLWRFWRHLPRSGRFTIYDRSWYGRVLVERVEGFAAPSEWRRAYAEINDFERQLCDGGRNVVCKFWLHFSPEEQLRRFKEREKISYKRHKITEEDYRNREKWHQYERAADDMVGNTSTAHAPWTLVEAETKHFARLKVLETVCERLKAAL